jgi:uncharacterized repeat protein (TIGR01451 family)
LRNLSLSFSLALAIAVSIATLVQAQQSTGIVAEEAELGVTKSGPAFAEAGTAITYFVTITNNGPATAVDVSIGDHFPLNTSFVSVTQTSGPPFVCTAWALDFDGGVDCDAAALAAGASASFELVFFIHPTATGTITNTATVAAAADNDSILSNNAATVVTAIGAGIPTLSPLALALMALSLAGIVLFPQR